MSDMRRCLKSQERETKKRRRRRAEGKRVQQEEDEQVDIAVALLDQQSQGHCPSSQVGCGPNVDRHRHSRANEELWERTNFPPILPPVYHKQPGRPKKVRAREKDEKPAASTGSKLSRSFHVKIKCSICGEQGHNKRKCDQRGGANNINKVKRSRASRGQPSTISEQTIQPNLANTSTYQPCSSLPMESQPISSVTTNTTRKFRLKSLAKKTKI
ncbi:hypothetical protein L3X38_018238 [Prunus dulcis]|uniref:CCHC-type domain-containing protein n=1 Tax=Prunus dulcis TaxID=3755 RepID=A0AAD4W9D1_PRUDU|nr:hypothetical protein L3X38_018238 [Prunus dulcis]